MKSVQRGTLTLNASSTTVAVTSVNTAKAILEVSFKEVAHGAMAGDINSSMGTFSATSMSVTGGVKAVLTNSTTLTFTAGGNADIAWQLVEFY